ncbi:hypothetical protein Efla_004068 [Eimeria flavescens]
MATFASLSPQGPSSSSSKNKNSRSAGGSPRGESSSRTSSSSGTSSSSRSSSSRSSSSRSMKQSVETAAAEEASPPAGGASPSGTHFYNWVVSPLCNSLCAWFPSWVHPDFISFLGLCCASAAAYCCCAANVSSSGSELALAAFFWILYGLFDNIDGKQARRLGLCSAGGDFFDHSSDSVSSSFAALIILHMLCCRVSAPAAAAAAGQQQESTLNMHPTLFHFCFVMLSQVPFFIATWAHPIVGRTMLSASLEGPGSFSVDELNLLVIPGLLLLKARHPWVFALPLNEAVAAVPLLGPLVSPALSSCLHACRAYYLPLLQLPSQQQPRELTLGLCVLIASVGFSIVQSSK